MALFSHDSKFMRFMDRFVDLLWLNLVWVVFSLPLVTLGAATVAAFTVSLQLVDEEEGSLLRTFASAFRRNLLKGTGLWLVHAVALVALFLDFRLLSATADPPLVLLVFSIVTAVFVFAAFAYAYALVARYAAPVGRSLRQSVAISFRYPVRTHLLALVLALEVAMIFWNETTLLFGLLIGPMILIYTCGGMAKRIFQDLDRAGTAS